MDPGEEISREALLARTPEVYLAGGFLGADGAVRPELLGGDALAAATQLRPAGLSPQEMAFTYEAVTALLMLHEGAPGETPGAQMEMVLGEALATVGRMIRQPNNGGLVSWCRVCAFFVQSEADIAAFVAHMRAVLRMYNLIATLPPPGGDYSQALQPALPAGEPAL